MWSKVYSGKREAHTEMKKCWFYSVSVTRCLPNLKELTLPSGKTSCKRYIAAWEKDRDNISAIPCFKLMAMLQIPILFYPRNEVSVWNKYLVSTIRNRHSWSTGTQTPLIPVGWHIKHRQEIQNWCLTPHINKAASTKKCSHSICKSARAEQWDQQQHLHAVFRLPVRSPVNTRCMWKGKASATPCAVNSPLGEVAGEKLCPWKKHSKAVPPCKSPCKVRIIFLIEGSRKNKQRMMKNLLENSFPWPVSLLWHLCMIAIFREILAKAMGIRYTSVVFSGQSKLSQKVAHLACKGCEVFFPVDLSGLILVMIFTWLKNWFHWVFSGKEIQTYTENRKQKRYLYVSGISPSYKKSGLPAHRRDLAA